MKYLLFTFVLSSLFASDVMAAPSNQSSSSKFVIRKNSSDDNCVIISPEKLSIGVVFPEKSKLLLILPPDFPYVVGSEFSPRESDLVWITISNKSGLIDCIVISEKKSVSFASQEVIDILNKNEKEGKRLIKDTSDKIFEKAKAAEQGAAANP